MTVSNSLSQLAAEAAILSKAQFTLKHPYPFLLCENGRMPVLVPSRLEILSPATVVLPGAGKSPVGPLDAATLRSRPDGFSVFALLKSDRNPFAERILVGRAKNNDIVLSNQSVSKAHACFGKSGARMVLSAYETLNPTQLNGKTIPPNTSGVEVPDGAVVQFGNVRCHFFTSDSFYSLLVGR